ncbi:MAG TPA: 6,7-dimethyl-8-ribityllumazine synthase [Candidatus Krumholzibacteria bacterium]|nr:6,7-dimethyl-8-ribityllumazine synthase [Candidatus Krumholzibacteria bacterium]
MPNERRARLDASGRRVAVVASRFNEVVTRRLVDGAVECLRAHGVADGDITVYWVAGAFEVPQLAVKVAGDGKADGVVWAGAIIRGETGHYDVLSRTVTEAIESAAMSSGVPMTLAVLTTDTLDQAVDRAGGKHGNAGWNAAVALVELMSHWRA